MNIELMLKYQELERQYSKVRSDFNKSPIAQKYGVINTKLKEENEKLLHLGHDAELLKRNYTLKTEEINSIKTEIRDILGLISGAETEDEIAFYLKNADKLKVAISALEKSLNETIKNIDDISNAFEQTLVRLKSLSQEMKEVSEKIKPLSQEVHEKLDQIKALMLPLEKQLEPVFISTYNALVNNKTVKPPYIIEFDGDFCTGCGMSLTAQQLNNVLDKGIIRCPECGRILYKK